MGHGTSRATDCPSGTDATDLVGEDPIESREVPRCLAFFLAVMMRLRVWIGLAWGVWGGVAGSLLGGERPNIVIVMVDDMGFSDIGCYGGEIETPNLDRLAANGLRFKQFYNTGRCCPTRASLMTGLHPHQAGIGHMTETPEHPSPLFNEPYQGYLNQHCVTLAQVLRRAGYHTLMSGKWHLSYHRKEGWPLQRGFDRYFGIISGASHYVKPEGLRGLTLMNDSVEAPEGFYVTDAFTDYAIEFVETSLDKEEKPFFLYLAYTAPHWPLQAKSGDLAKYEGMYAQGWEAVSQKRWQRQVEMGLIDPDWTRAPHEGPSWSSLDEETRSILDLRMAAYAACIDAVDQNVGKLMAKLEALGKLDNTVFFFLSDNGACAEGGILGAGDEESVRNPLSTKGTAGPRCGRAWANASNTPFRLYKHFVHEGGMATPLVVHWPSGIPAGRRGSWVEDLGYLPDFMPTCLDLAGADYPTRWEGKDIPHHAGTSLVPLLMASDKPADRGAVYWEHEGNRAMREGDWKLVWSRQGPWELYDLSKDRTEMHDLTESFPRRKAEMQRRWEGWARRTGVQFQTSFSYYQMIRDYRTSQSLAQ